MNRLQLGPRRLIFTFLAGVVLVGLLRSLWTFPIEHGDAVQKYFISAQVLSTGDWTLLLHNHHTLRWAAMLPQILVTWLAGVRYEVFYLLPLLFFSMTLVMLVIGLRTHLRAEWLLLLALLLFAEPQGYGTSNQLLNPPLGVFYALAGTWLLVRAGPGRHALVALAAGLFFVAYGVHVTYLSFAGGALIWLLVCKRQFAAAAWFGLTLLALAALETVLFNLLSGGELTFGRIEALAYGPHVEKNLSREAVTLAELLGRWQQLPAFDLLLCAGFWISGGWMAAEWFKGRRSPQLLVCLFLVGMTYALAVTFAVVSLDPLQPAMGLRTMYLVPFLTFASIMTVYLMHELASRLFGQHFRAGAVAIVLLLAGMIVLNSRIPLLLNGGATAFVWRAQAEYADFSERFRQGQLVLGGRRQKVYSMIARFQAPVAVQSLEQGIAPLNLKPDHLCLQRLNRVPLALNYGACEP
jgi:hypothetical protein